MTKKHKNPYKKILDDAQKSLGRKYPDTQFIDGVQPSKPSQSPVFPYGKPAKREVGWI